MIPAQRIAAGAAAYIEREILPHLSMSKALIAGAAAALYLRQIDDIIAKIPKGMNITDEYGNVDLDAVCDALKQNMHEPVPIDLPLIGRMTFDQAEIDKLRRYIMEN